MAGRLKEQHKLFCLHYVNCLNATRAYMQVYGAGYKTASECASRLLAMDKIQDEIARLKSERAKELPITKHDLAAYCLKVLGADIGDYYESDGTGGVKLKDLAYCDTSMIQELKPLKDGGGAIKLVSKEWAIDTLRELISPARPPVGVTINNTQATQVNGGDFSPHSPYTELSMQELRALARLADPSIGGEVVGGGQE